MWYLLYVAGLIPGLTAYILKHKRPGGTFLWGLMWEAASILPLQWYCAQPKNFSNDDLVLLGWALVVVGFLAMLVLSFRQSTTANRIQALVATLVSGSLLGLLAVALGFCHFGF